MSTLPEKLLGNYVLTESYKYQEDTRRATLILCKDPKNPLFINGWASLFAMKMISYQYKNISLELKNLADKCFEHLQTVDINRNIRKEIKQFLMYPLKGYPEWIDFDKMSSHSVESLNKQFKGKPFKLETVDGKLYCTAPEKPENYQNREYPHITLVNSDVYKKDIHGKLEGTEISDIEFTGIAATYSFDYPLFGTCVVAKLKSKTLEDIMNGFNIKKSLHLTIYEEPKEEHLFLEK